MKPRIIVCNLGRTGYQIFRLLRQQGAIVVGVNEQPVKGEGSDVVVGSFRAASTLLAAGIQSAHTLVLAGNDDATNLAILMQARILNPKIRIISRLFNTNLGQSLDRILPDHSTMSVSALAAPVFTFAALGSRAIGQLRLFNQTWPIHEEFIDPEHPWVGKSLHDLWCDRDRMLIYYIPNNSHLDLVSAVLEGQKLDVGDRLIIATKPSIRTQRFSLYQRGMKFINSLKKFQQHGKKALLITLVLMLTIFLATLTYVSINLDNSLVDSLYFSVGMITGAGGNEKVAENAPDSIKIFTAIMMLVGAGVIGICYALLNDFVLGTRLTEYLNATRVPQRNHYIICGLGGIGVQIAEQLHRSGYEVVVIDRDPNCRFISTVRSLRIPFVEGDASLSSILESVNVQQAEALLAVTSDDTANLEIALSARAIAPHLRMIVRNQDAQFGLMVQQVFDFETVLSPTEIATPAFAAAAIGGRILGNGITADSLWVALATLITANHPFCGQRVKDVATRVDFVPLYIETNSQTIHSWKLLDSLLSPGDVLYLTLPAHRLQQLWHPLSINRLPGNLSPTEKATSDT
ncbi:potassium channel protein [Arthrospira sp. O9.13F]|nr:potassium channel protein [Arthrospira sp. O9.13F]